MSDKGRAPPTTALTAEKKGTPHYYNNRGVDVYGVDARETNYAKLPRITLLLIIDPVQDTYIRYVPYPLCLYTCSVDKLHRVLCVPL